MTTAPSAEPLSLPFALHFDGPPTASSSRPVDLRELPHPERAAALAITLARNAGQRVLTLLDLDGAPEPGVARAITVDLDAVDHRAALSRVIQDAPAAPIALAALADAPGLLVAFTTGEAPGEAEDLHLLLTPERLLVEPRVIPDTAAERLARQIERVASAPPEAPLDTIELLSEAERASLLERASGPQPSSVEDTTAHRLFEEITRLEPDAIAVSFLGHNLSYSELDSRANQLAHHLLGLGVHVGDRVGLCLDRSSEVCVAILGILKAGAAYVPLDPAYPARRLEFMLHDSDVSALVSQSTMSLPALPEGATRVDLDDVDLSHSPARATGLPSVSGDDLAYVIYTSGSTGRPKGVEMHHGPLVNLMRWQVARSPAGSGRTLQFAPISFDVSFQECFATWCAGGTLVLVEDAARRDFDRLLTVLEEQRIQRLFLPFVALDQLTRTAERHDVHLTHLEELITAGEQLRVTPSLRACCARWGCTLENQYGPTETHVITAYRLDPAPEAWDELPPIGTAIAGGRVYILDEAMRPVPTGVVGELYLGGRAVARGYLGREALTADRFLDNPFHPGRIYRTGDLARWQEDGEIAFLGRVDHQVKIRGFRIELGEVEAALDSCEGVGQCAVMARRHADSRYLAAYIVPEPGAELHADTLRAALQRLLPDYMTPSAFFTLPALPLAPSGKVDRKRLAEVSEATRLHSSRDYIAPRSGNEATLAEVWRELLGVEEISRSDDFFTLGGHSLLALQVVSRIQATFGVRLSQEALFQAPTIASLTRIIEAHQERDALPPVEPVSASERVLSFAQERLHFVHQFNRDSPVYNISYTIALRGELDGDALHRALDTIAERHAILRSNIVSEAGRPRVVIRPMSTWALTLIDLGGMNAMERGSTVYKREREEAHRPFDLDSETLLRLMLIRLTSSHHLLLMTVHHIIFDGWSMDIFLSELSALYAHYTSEDPDAPNDLPPMPVQFHDAAAWERRVYSREALASSLDYWREKMAGLGPLELRSDHPRPARTQDDGALFGLRIPSTVVARLKSLGQRHGATLFMTLLSAYKILLARYSGQRDICVGSPIARRPRVELEPLIGFFVNTLALRTHLDEAPTFLEVLASVRATVLEAFAHQAVPLDELVSLAGERDPSRHPLFQVAFVLGDDPVVHLDLPGLDARVTERHTNTSKFDLTLQLTEGPDGGLLGFIEYATALFEHRTVSQIGNHFKRLLELISDTPERPITELPLLDDTERGRVFGKWNDTDAPCPTDATLHGFFEAQVDARPDHPALVYQGEAITFAELDARANQLAHRLLDAGVTPGERIGVSVQRSPEMVVAIFGILKAGAAYVPLDPTYPEGRLAFMVKDSGVRRVVIAAEDGPISAALQGVERVPARADDGAPRERPSVAVSGHDLAYVIYTSGSTGRPKGAMLEHRGPINLAIAQRGIFELNEARVLQFASLNFDASVWEITMSLLSGHTLVLMSPGTAQNPLAVRDLIRDTGVTAATLPPVLLRELDPTDLPELTTLVSAGEACTAELVSAWSPGRTFYNAYGPTESSVCATIYRCPEGMTEAPSIGSPLPNIQIRILDAHDQPVPVGVAGELMISSAISLARGYLGREALTAERFQTDPFDSTRRMYRSGDLAMWRGDGTIEFLGRVDHQVKLRGFRIELGEIEAVLEGTPQVEACAVIVHGEGSDAMLIGYLAPGADYDEAAVRAALARELPAYMVPALLIPLDALPQTPNGKVDRRALEARDIDDARSDADRSPARDALEEAVAEIFSDVLGVPVGIHGSFFDYGGHSLKATQLMLRLHERFGVMLRLSVFFEAPTVASATEQIRALRRNGSQLVSELDLQAEITLPAELTPAPDCAPVAARRDHVLLTGATGFLGAFLLDGLLAEDDTRITCLVRAPNPEAGLGRVRDNLNAFGIWRDEHAERLTIVCGDLAEPHFGLDEATWSALTEDIDAVIHNGARVNFVLTYAQLKPANVDGTLTILELAMARRLKPVHFVSTLSSVPLRGDGAPILEEFPKDWARLEGGYAQTKWVGEALTLEARRRGLPTFIYRPTIVSGRSSDGAWTAGDFFTRVIKGSVMMGQFPDWRLGFNMVPVDQCAAWILRIARAPRLPRDSIFHIAHPESYSRDLLVEKLRERGYTLEITPESDWIGTVVQLAQEGASEHPLVSLIGFFGESYDFNTPSVYDTQKATAMISSDPLQLEPPEALLERYFDALRASDYLPEP